MRANDYDDRSLGGQMLSGARRRAVCVAVASAFALSAAPASGLSLLEARVQSYLGERLVAEIPYSAAPGERLTRNCLRGGPPATGRLPVIRHLEFFVDRSRQVIGVTSTYAIREPLASLIVEVACPGIPVLVREYTLSLDPPILGHTRLSSAPRAAPMPSPTLETAEPQTQRRSAVQQRAKSPAGRDIDAGSQYRVQIGDSLSTIAFRVRQRTPNSTWQWAERIHALNPSAFIDGDPDLLKAGSLLDIPAAPAGVVASSVAAPAAGETVTSPPPAPTDLATPIRSEESFRQELALLEQQRQAPEALERPEDSAVPEQIARPAATAAATPLEPELPIAAEEPAVEELEVALEEPVVPVAVSPAERAAAPEPLEASKGPSTMIAALAVSVTGILGVLLLAFGVGRRRAYSRSQSKAVPARRRPGKTEAPKIEPKPRDLPAFDDTMTVVEISMPSPLSDTGDEPALTEQAAEDVDTQIGATPISANELQRLFSRNESSDSVTASQTMRLPDSETPNRSADDTARLDTSPPAEVHEPDADGRSEDEPTQEINVDTELLVELDESDTDADTIEQSLEEAPADELPAPASPRDKAVGED